MAKKGKWTKTIMKFQRPIFGSDNVLMYNKDRSIMGEQPMDTIFALLFGERYKIYCKCRFNNEDGYLEIGEEVEADW